MMLSSLLLCALSLASPSLTAPTSHLSKRLAENTPWHLSNLVLGPSTFTFHFSDTNTGLELETDCSRSVTAGSNQSIVDSDTYYACGNHTVSYRLGNDGAIDVKRNYIDPAVGDYPYWFVTAFGQATIPFSSSNSTGVATATGVDVPITSEIA